MTLKYFEIRMELPLWATGWWFPPQGSPAYEAKRVCASCPVRSECLATALVGIEDFGIWGGAGEGRRRHLRKLLLRSPHPHPPRWEGVAVKGCRCPFHKALADHWRRLDELGDTGRRSTGRFKPVLDTWTHGRRATYAGGCRCPECCEAARGPRGKKDLLPEPAGCIVTS